MHGELIDNLIMGLFNLNFAMSDYEESLTSHSCSQVNFKSVTEWTEVSHGITHESMSVMRAKINEHLEDATNSSQQMEKAWAIQDYVTAGVKAAEIAKIATHDCLPALNLLLLNN